MSRKNIRHVLSLYPEIEDCLHLPRERDAVAIAYLDLINGGTDPREVHCVIQIDQSIDRMPIQIGFSPCVTPKGKYWYTFLSDEQLAPRLLSPLEKFRLQGVGPEEWRRLNVDGATLPENMVNDLAGNAFSANVIVAFMLSVLIAWH